MVSEREASVEDIEKKVREGIMDAIQPSPGCRILIPTIIDKGHPAFIVGTSDGLFLVSVQKVSASLVEAVEGAADGTG